jgi:hypothetical protein
MSIKLLSASVDPVEPSEALEVSKSSLVPLTQAANTTPGSQISLVPDTDAFAWSSSTRRGGANRIYATFVENSQSDRTGRSGGGGEYLSGWPWSHSVEGTAIAQYLSYAAGLAGWNGRLIDLYA